MYRQSSSLSSLQQLPVRFSVSSGLPISQSHQSHLNQFKMCKSINANDFFAYTTPKLVRIHDKRLGILNYVLMAGILIYVVVYNIVYSNQAFLYGKRSFFRDRP